MTSPSLPTGPAVYIVSGESGLIFWLPLLWETDRFYVGDAGPRRRLEIHKDPNCNTGVWGYPTFEAAREAHIKLYTSGVQRLSAEAAKLALHLKDCEEGLTEAITCTGPVLLDYEYPGPLGGHLYKIEEDQS